MQFEWLLQIVYFVMHSELVFSTHRSSIIGSGLSRTHSASVYWMCLRCFSMYTLSSNFTEHSTTKKKLQIEPLKEQFPCSWLSPSNPCLSVTGFLRFKVHILLWSKSGPLSKVIQFWFWLVIFHIIKNNRYFTHIVWNGKVTIFPFSFVSTWQFKYKLVCQWIQMSTLSSCTLKSQIPFISFELFPTTIIPLI